MPKTSRNQEYFDPTNTTISPPKVNNTYGYSSFASLNQSEIQLKPILLEKKLGEKEEFANLGDGFKRIFAAEDDEKIVIPVSGYTGHRKGAIAGNLFGKSYRQITIQSKKVERESSLNKSSFIK